MREGIADLLRARRSVRRFSPRPVDPALLERALESAIWAPSAGNRQDWLFTVATSGAVRAEVAALSRARWEEIVQANRELGIAGDLRAYARTVGEIPESPVLVAVSAPRPNSLQRHLLGDDPFAAGSAASAAMAAQNLMLAAHGLGLGSCCLTGPLAAAEGISAALGIPARHAMVCLVSLGWPEEAPAPPPRKSLKEVVRWRR